MWCICSATHHLFYICLITHLAGSSQALSSVITPNDDCSQPEVASLCGSFSQINNVSAMREQPTKVVRARRRNTQRHSCDVVSLFLFYKKLSKRPVSPRLDYINALSVLGLPARFCCPVPVLIFFSFLSLTWQRVWSAKNLPHPRCFACAVQANERPLLSPRLPSSTQQCWRRHNRARTITGELKQLESDDAEKTMAMYQWHAINKQQPLVTQCTRNVLERNREHSLKW